MKEQLEKIRQEALGALESVKDAGETRCACAFSARRAS